jgi:hypothetical protein
MRIAGATGREPAASCETGRHFNNLNYALALLVRLPDCSLPFPLIPNCVRRLTESVVIGGGVGGKRLKSSGADFAFWGGQGIC